ncbi:unnamed protein product [Protopolystoma xenopodis]|uniref:Uncharacterized protein n=1 Tax=Protopolystoma xenopodis TaxID=117903 RepID=A0A448XNE6_9PLAT|nr:unnamed protein product [Protopolystoma xenopodis]
MMRMPLRPATSTSTKRPANPALPDSLTGVFVAGRRADPNVRRLHLKNSSKATPTILKVSVLSARSRDCRFPPQKYNKPPTLTHTHTHTETYRNTKKQTVRIILINKIRKWPNTFLCMQIKLILCVCACAYVCVCVSV